MANLLKLFCLLGWMLMVVEGEYLHPCQTDLAKDSTACKDYQEPRTILGVQLLSPGLNINSNYVAQDIFQSIPKDLKQIIKEKLDTMSGLYRDLSSTLSKIPTNSYQSPTPSVASYSPPSPSYTFPTSSQHYDPPAAFKPITPSYSPPAAPAYHAPAPSYNAPAPVYISKPPVYSPHHTYHG